VIGLEVAAGEVPVDAANESARLRPAGFHLAWRALYAAMSGKWVELHRWATYGDRELANLALRAGSGCPRKGFKKARK
jgi:hypothetical protein